MDRLQALQRWITEDLGMLGAELKPASSDASFRRYFRVFWQDQTMIAMDAPPDKEDVKPFIHVAELLEGYGLHVPHIHQRNLDEGFLLLSDMGSTDYLSSLNDASVDDLYRDAIDAIARMQKGGAAGTIDLPPYDNAVLQREMALFPEWFLQHHLQLTLSAEDQAMLQQACDVLAASALAQPVVVVHRDYHSRNLMYCPDNNPGVLDFQDALAGPISYDLVSLLRDCYIRWPLPRVQGWLAYFYQQLDTPGTDLAGFERWFDLMGAQRHLKAIGIFARLNWRDGKPGYLGDIPRTLGYVRDVAAKYPELAALGAFIEQRVIPELNDNGTSRAQLAGAMA